MRLYISNIGKIKNADIIMDGITVITGKNNSAKSTVGKALYSLFNSMWNIRQKAAEQRVNRIINQIRLELERRVYKEKKRSFEVGVPLRRVKSAIKDDIRFILGGEESGIAEIVRVNITKHLADIGIQIDEETQNELIAIIEEVIDVSEDALKHELISNYFSAVFDGQIRNVYIENDKAEVGVTIRDKTILVRFDADNNCTETEIGLDLEHEAFFIDDPLVIDDMSYVYRRGFSEGHSQMQKDLTERLRRDERYGDVIETVTAKEKLQMVYSLLGQTLDGRVVQENGNLAFQENNGSEKKVRITNVSTGSKAFMLIRLLLERGIIREKDVVILDEPEIHLHAEWQKIYAEIIVLLQKHFDLTILITTHSSQFARAIETYTIKHDIVNKCRFYQAEVMRNEVQFVDKTGAIEEMYYTMVAPEIELEQLFDQVTDSEDE